MAREWSVTTESVKRSSERIGELVSKYQTEYEKLYTEAVPLHLHRNPMPMSAV